MSRLSKLAKLVSLIDVYGGILTVLTENTKIDTFDSQKPTFDRNGSATRVKGTRETGKNDCFLVVKQGV